MHTEPWSKINMVLFDRQVAYLDRLTADVRRQTGRRLNRTQIVRALIDALALSKFKLSKVATEAELIGRLRRKLS